MPTVFLHSKVRLHWGFVVRQIGASAAQLAYALPPPPTVVGSFMNPLARILGLGELLDPKRGPAGSAAMACALRATLSAAAGLDPDSPVGVTVYAEPSRITAGPYKTGGDRTRALKEPPYLAADRLLPVQAAGAASSPGGVLILAWLVDASRLSGCLGCDVDLRELRTAASSVYRVGSREGLVSVVEAGAFEGEELHVIAEGAVFGSVLYQPAACVKPLDPGSVAEATLYDLGYRERAYVVPGFGGPSGVAPPPEEVAFELRGGCRAAAPKASPALALSHTLVPGVA